MKHCTLISHDGFKIILKNCSSLIALDVRGNCNFKNKTVDILLECKKIEELYFSENHIKSKSFKKILQTFQKSLKILKFCRFKNYNKFTYTVLKDLMSEKMKIFGMKVLNLSFNGTIDKISMKAICEVFPNLEYFKGRDFGFLNFQIKNPFLKSNWKFTLKKLDFDYDFEDSKFVYDRLKKFKNLLHLFISFQVERKYNNRFIVYNYK